MEMVRLSALRTGRLYPPGNIPGTHFCQRLSRPQGHSAARRIVSMKNSNDTIGNRTRDLPTCSAVPQPTAPPTGAGAELFHADRRTDMKPIVALGNFANARKKALGLNSISGEKVVFEKVIVRKTMKNVSEDRRLSDTG